MNNKKIATITFMFMTTIALSGCTIINRVVDNINDIITDDKNGTNNTNADFDVTKVDVDGKTIIAQTYKDYSDNNVYPIDYCPTKGTIKLLIIPVWFSDSSTYIETSNKDRVRQDIQKAYLGTNEETGWRSVKTYYEELSSGAVTITGTVTNWYSVSYTTSQLGKSEDLTCDLVEDATAWYFSNNPSDNKVNYDSDNNGYFDAVMLIYGAPDYSALNNDNLDNLWAYCNWIQKSNETTSPIVNVFFWASYDFMYSPGGYFTPTPAGTKYGSGDTSHCEIDAHTFIHEMGHVFGLEDYYDYSSSKYCPAGGFSMQDYNVGSHDPYSVMALGWANPYIVNQNAEVNIGTFQKTREFILLTEEFNSYGSPFDEYILLELYSPTGLNELDCKYTYASTLKGPNKVGIRMWHVDARLAYSNTYTSEVHGGTEYITPVFKAENITTNAKESKATYGVFHAFSNTYNSEQYGSVLGKKYYNYNILQMIRRDTRETVATDNTISDSDLFISGSYGLSNYKSQFVNSSPIQMNNGSFADWNIKIEISGSGNDATAKISIVK